jgi:hypothetical protein
MVAVAAQVRPSYLAPSSCVAAAASAWAFRERRAPYPTPRTGAAGPSRRITPPPHLPVISAPVGLHLKPGQKGTRHLVEQYGDRLVCVRYRYDATRKKRLKTVELVVAESRWEPRFAPDDIVALRIAFTDVAARQRVKQAGGTWNPDRTVWQLRYDRVVALGLRRRIVSPRHPVLDAAASSDKHPAPDAGPASP